MQMEGVLDRDGLIKGYAKKYYSVIDADGYLRAVLLEADRIKRRLVNFGPLFSMGGPLSAMFYAGIGRMNERMRGYYETYKERLLESGVFSSEEIPTVEELTGLVIREISND